ncbi:beta strand repeat-containing protein [Silvimonas iriomotensis]|uniref:Big-1 domain-containing protein n=1 Tax=Silvimonas iriomotensis TaxID=449662 RepID=A0ABQ2PBJ2_9NEIS|nr:Ig-like domain-containing protein [Silvimonas iriomotensis]GGP22887.1 hypothetical protein GCM10010970_28870 [Silvimonas iriomotensis]
MIQAQSGRRAWQVVKLLALPLLASATIALSACNGAADGSTLNGGSGSGSTTPTPTPTPTTTPTPVAVQAASLVVLADKTSLLSGSTDVATLTITALDGSNAVLPNAPITVSSASGILSASTVVTNATGVATVTYTPGQNRANRTEVISLANGTVKSSTAIVVAGTKVLTTIPTGTSLPVGSPQTVNATVTDGKGQLVSGAVVNFAVVGAGGSASLSSATATTNSSGIASVSINGIAAGGVTLNTSVLGATASNTLNVAGANTFAITNPPAQSTLQTNASTNIIVSSATSTTVQFVASIGGFGAGVTPTTSAPVTAGGTVTVSFKSTTSGVATITAFDSANPNVSSSVTIAVSAPASQATAVTLQATPSVLSPSSGSQTSSSVLTIRVTDGSNNGVANVPVALSFTGGPGGGESVSPSYVVTGSSGTGLGVATATFTAGSLPTSQGSPITITATPLVNGTSVPPSSTSIVIGGTAGSVAIGQSNAMTESSDGTTYILPMSVIVADSNGNPMANTTVSLSAWPVAFSVSNIVCPSFASPLPTGERSYTLANEDANENLIADSGEIYSVHQLDNNSFATTTGTPPTAVTSPSRSSTIPPNSAAGTIPATVTTDASGRASFNYTFLKSSAQWIVTRIRATTQVQGTQATAQSVFRLPVLAKDVSPTCTLPPSPYNSYYSGI